VVDSIASWLERHGLAKYAEAFRQQEIGFETLPDVTEADLKEMGLPIGPRRVFLRGVANDFGGSLTSRDQQHGGFAELEPTAAPKLMPPNPAQDAERRLLTICFVDLVGSTQLAVRFDPEELREIMRGYLDTVAQVTQAYGGHVARYLGDGVMSVFGWPHAYEDQTERAALAALDSVRRVRELRLRPKLRLDVRVGIASGHVVVGDTGDDTEIAGQAPNLAQRLQSSAEPGQVIIDKTTSDLVVGRFRLIPQPPVAAKGFDNAVPAFLLSESKTLAIRFQPDAPAARQAMVGREAELALLIGTWHEACAGRAQTVLVEGEPGIGKSRLVSEFRRNIGVASRDTIGLQCVDYRSGSAFFPVQQALQRLCGFVHTDVREARRRKLKRFVRNRVSDQPLAFSLLAALLSIETPEDDARIAGSTADAKRSTIEVLVELTIQRHYDRPLLIVLEDAHWCDPTTLEYIALAVARATNQRIMLVVTTRPGHQFLRGSIIGATHVHLDRLTRTHAEAVVASQISERLSTTSLEALLRRSEGIPLYLVELSRAHVQSTLGEDIPESIQSSFLASIDQLGHDKRFVQFLSVLGFSFSRDFVLEAWDGDSSDASAALGRLQATGFLVRDEASVHGNYHFRHALIQEAAYGSVLRRTREDLHDRVANVLCAAMESRGNGEPEIIARHLSLAGRADEAVPAWQQAGDRLGQRSAHIEAAEQYQRGLDDLAKLPASADRHKREYDLRVRLAAALTPVVGWSATQVAEAYKDALQLAKTVGDPYRQFIALRGKFNVLFLQGRLTQAREVIPELSNTADRSGDWMLMNEAMKVEGLCALHEADFERAVEYLELAISGLSTAESSREQALVFGIDPALTCLSGLAWARWFMGCRDAADACIGRALSLAKEGGHAFSEAYACGFAACLCQFAGDATGAKTHADTVIRLAAKYHFPYWEGWGRILSGWSLGHIGRGEDGLTELNCGIEIYRSTGAQQMLPYAFSLRRELLQKAATESGVVWFPSHAEDERTDSESRFYKGKADPGSASPVRDLSA
jgi:class 3 adenylate cyclase/tetratricopeptide (TPR) repeat protein